MEEECNINLGLAIGSNENYSINISHGDHKKQAPVQFHILFPPRPRDEELEEEEDERQQQQQEKKGSRDRDQEEDSFVRENRGSKKLRLTEEQASLLEDSFRINNTLNSYQKQQLAEKLKLRPRQVEVWFQNRRARNKMKRTEVDFQLLKRWCETLNEENRKLKQELHDLKVVQLSLCSSCKDAPVTTSKKSSSGDSTLDY